MADTEYVPADATEDQGWDDQDWDDQDWDDWDSDGSPGWSGGCGDEEEEAPIPLTQRVKMGGWACKWRPGEFQSIARGMMPAFGQESALGLADGDDCAILRINDDQASVFTLDWFTPITDDPYEFGAVSAAASLSKLYATGAKPLTALNMMALPCKLGVDQVGEVMRGGSDKVIEAGAFVVGGHSIDDDEPKYGLATFGIVNPRDIVCNERACPGDVLLCTKMLGTGVMSEAYRAGVEDEDGMRQTLDSMMELDKAAAQAAQGLDLHAAVAITGQGVAGHLHQLLESCGAAANLAWDALPLLDRAWQHCRDGLCPDRTAKTVQWAAEFVTLACEDAAERDVRMNLLCDPQTSGGLLVALPEADAEAFARAFESETGRVPARIGRIVEGPTGEITVS